MRMFQKSLAPIALLFLSFPINPAFTQVSTASQLSYADLADLSVETPLVIEAEIKSAIRVKPERAPGLLQGYQSFYVEAQVINLIRGQNGIGRDINYLVDRSEEHTSELQSLMRSSYAVFCLTQKNYYRS